MRRITSSRSRGHRGCRQSQRIQLLAFSNPNRREEHYRRRHWFTATSFDRPLPPPPSNNNQDDESQMAQVEPLRNPKDQKGRNRLQNLLEKGPARWRWERSMLKNLAMELLGDWKSCEVTAKARHHALPWTRCWSYGQARKVEAM